MPANLQNLHLQITNHNIKMNDQLKHFAKDESNAPVKGDCTFCTINGVEHTVEERYKPIFLECNFSRSALDPIATKYNIPIPDTKKKEKRSYTSSYKRENEMKSAETPGCTWASASQVSQMPQDK